MPRRLRVVGPSDSYRRDHFFSQGILPWLAGGAALLVYGATLCPAVWWISSGELIASAETLGIPHAPGASPYVLLGRLFTLLFPASPEWGVNLISALSAAFVVGASVQLSLSRFKNSPLVEKGAALLAAAFLAGSLCLWTQATVGERRTFLLALFAGALLVFRDYLETSRLSRLLTASFILGIASAVRPNAPVFLLAAGLFLLVLNRKITLQPFILSMISFFLGISVSLYLPLRFPLAPFCFLTSGAAHFIPWVKELMGLSFVSHFKPTAPVSLSGQIPGFFMGLVDEFGPLGVLAIVVGLVRYFRSRDIFSTFLLLLLAVDAATWIPFRPFGQGIRHYVLFSFFLLVPFLASGIGGLLAGLRQPFFRIAVFSALTLGAFLNGWTHLSAADRSDDFSASDYADASLALTKDAQALFVDYDNEYFPLLPRWYEGKTGPKELIYTGDYELKHGASWTGALVQSLSKGDVFLTFRDPGLEKKVLLVPEGPLYQVARTPPVQLGPVQKGNPLAAFEGGIRLEEAIPQSFHSRLLTLDLAWSRQTRTTDSFWVETYLVRGGQYQLLSLFPPAHGFYPPARWKPETAVHERDIFLLPADISAGSYEIQIVLRPASAVHLLAAQPLPAPDTLYSEANPFSGRYGGMAGSLGRFQQVLPGPPTEEGFLKPQGQPGPAVTVGLLQVEPDKALFPGGPAVRGQVRVIPAANLISSPGVL